VLAATDCYYYIQKRCDAVDTLIKRNMSSFLLGRTEIGKTGFGVESAQIVE
jgi:hypothetical protein